jgi:hypothetical protein
LSVRGTLSEDPSSFALGCVRWLLSARWQPGGAQSGIVEHNDASALQRLLDPRQIDEKQGGLPVGPTVVGVPEADHRRATFAAQREQRAEFDIRGDKNTVLPLGPL